MSEEQETSTGKELDEILDLEEIDVNLYRGITPRTIPRWGRIYGGQTVAQALVAAVRTVNPPFVVHSLHAYFVLPGDDNNVPILYHVNRIRDGKTFCTRDVVASQKGKAIFQMGVSFHIPEDGYHHQYVMPDTSDPDQMISMDEQKRKTAMDPRAPAALRAQMLRDAQFPFPFDIRRKELVDMFVPPQKTEPRHQVWMRVTSKLADSPMLHQCALAYLSDWTLLSTSLLPHGVRSFGGQHVQPASIDHSMWFHGPFNADEWMLYDMESPWAGSGRGLNHGRIYTRDGRLIVSVAQEGLIRLVKQPTAFNTNVKKQKRAAEGKASGSGGEESKSSSAAAGGSDSAAAGSGSAARSVSSSATSAAPSGASSNGSSGSSNGSGNGNGSNGDIGRIESWPRTQFRPKQRLFTQSNGPRAKL